MIGKEPFPVATAAGLLCSPLHSSTSSNSSRPTLLTFSLQPHLLTSCMSEARRSAEVSSFPLVPGTQTCRSHRRSPARQSFDATRCVTRAYSSGAAL